MRLQVTFGNAKPGADMRERLQGAWLWLRPVIWVMRVLEPGESKSLAEHVLDKAKSLAALAGATGSATTVPPATGSTAAVSPTTGKEAGTLNDWVKYRFTGPLESSSRAGPDYSRAFTTLSLLTIGAGLASSVLASANKHPSPVAIGILGLAVGVLTAVNRLWNPAQRSSARFQAAYSLRREGWEFVNDRGRYARLKPEQRLGAFLDEINRIHRAVEAIDETASSPSGG